MISPRLLGRGRRWWRGESIGVARAPGDGHPDPIYRILLAFSSHASVNNGTFNLDFESTVQQRRTIGTEQLTIIWAKIWEKLSSF
jgi:hypothetical protein